MKALKILKEQREIYLKIYNGDDYCDGIDSYKDKVIELDEAIEELEELNKKLEASKEYFNLKLKGTFNE